MQRQEELDELKAHRGKRSVGEAEFYVSEILDHKWRSKSKPKIQNSQTISFLCKFTCEAKEDKPSWQWLESVQFSSVFRDYALNKPSLKQFLEEDYFDAEEEEQKEEEEEEKKEEKEVEEEYVEEIEEKYF